MSAVNLRQMHDKVLREKLAALVREEKNITAQVIEHISDKIKSGELNLTQISNLAQAIRRKGVVSHAEKTKILADIQGKDIRDTQVEIHRALDLQPEKFDKKSFQKDESVRVELTFSKEQWELLARVKEVLSQVNPNPNIATVFEKLAQEFLRRKDPARTVPENVWKATSARKSQRVKKVSLGVRREVFQKQNCCQWEEHGKKCESRFQLQLDHIHPRWAGGSNDRANLQLLCGVHNRRKFAKETGQK